MKKPKCIELAEQYCERTHGFNNHEYDAYLAGYDAAQKIVETMLKSVQANRSFNDPSVVKPPSVETVLEQVLAELEET